MSYLINGLLIVAVILLIGRKQPDKFWFFIGAILKLAAGILLGWIHLEYYRGGDTFEYYNSALELSDLPFSEWWSKIRSIEIGPFPNQPRAILFTKIVSFFILVTQGDYWIVSLYFSLISFLVYWYFYRQILSTLPNLKWPVLIGFILLPSTIFWSAGILKGSLTDASIVFLSAFGLKLFFKKVIYPHDLFAAAIAIVLLLYIKYYLLILVAPLIIYCLFDIRAYHAGLTKQIRGSMYAVIIILTLFIAPSINPNLNVADLPIAIHENQLTFGHHVTIPVRIEPNWFSLLQTLPKSTWIGLFGPTLLDSGMLFGLIPRIENLLILSFTIFSFVLLVRKKLWSPDILVIGTLIFIILLCAFLPMAAPNYGALVRYRAPVTPFLVMLVTILPIWWIQEKFNH